MDNIKIYCLRFRVTQLFSVVMYRDSIHSDQHPHAHSSHYGNDEISIVLPNISDTKSKNDGNHY